MSVMHLKYINDVSNIIPMIFEHPYDIMHIYDHLIVLFDSHMMHFRAYISWDHNVMRMFKSVHEYFHLDKSIFFKKIVDHHL